MIIRTAVNKPKNDNDDRIDIFDEGIKGIRIEASSFSLFWLFLPFVTLSIAITKNNLNHII